MRVIARRQEAKVSTLQVAYLEEPEEPAALLGLGVVHILLQLRPHKGVASALCNGCCWGEGAFRDDERREGAPQPAAC